MRELQRVLGDKRVIIVFVLILIINGILFYQSMQPDSSLEQQNKELYGDDYRKNAEEKKEYYFDYYGKMDVDLAFERLKKEGYSVNKIHGGMLQKDRTFTMESFKRGEFRILVATDVCNCDFIFWDIK